MEYMWRTDGWRLVMRCVDWITLNIYYDVSLKHDRLAVLQDHINFGFIKRDPEGWAGVARLFDKEHYDVAIHLATKASALCSLGTVRVC